MNTSFVRPELSANVNLFNLAGNPYPGRGIVVGLDETGENLVQVYWIMGRSENSRNRIFGSEGGRLFTEAADPSKVKDPSLIIYNAMRESWDTAGFSYAVVSNGSQTDTVVMEGMSGLNRYSYEPDAPNFTPRITACSFWRRIGGLSGAMMSILRKSPWSESILQEFPWVDACDQHLYKYAGLYKGFGYCLTTYSGDGNPLPAFHGEPCLLPLVGGAPQVAETFWSTLNADNRVSLAVKFIPKDGPSKITIINKYSKV